jgi:hypothetical protein
MVISKANQFQSHLVHQKYLMKSPGIEPEAPPLEASVLVPELWHSLGIFRDVHLLNVVINNSKMNETFV